MTNYDKLTLEEKMYLILSRSKIGQKKICFEIAKRTLKDFFNRR